MRSSGGNNNANAVAQNSILLDVAIGRPAFLARTRGPERDEHIESAQQDTTVLLLLRQPVVVPLWRCTPCLESSHSGPGGCSKKRLLQLLLIPAGIRIVGCGLLVKGWQRSAGCRVPKCVSKGNGQKQKAKRNRKKERKTAEVWQRRTLTPTGIWIPGLDSWTCIPRIYADKCPSHIVGTHLPQNKYKIQLKRQRQLQLQLQLHRRCDSNGDVGQN